MSGTSVSPRRAKVLFRTVAMIPHGHAAQAHAALHHGSLATGGNIATIGVCGLTGGLHEYRAGLLSPHIWGGNLDADADTRMKVSDVMRARTCHDRHPACHQDAEPAPSRNDINTDPAEVGSGLLMNRSSPPFPKLGRTIQHGRSRTEFTTIQGCTT